jgi:hypothetical protein
MKRSSNLHPTLYTLQYISLYTIYMKTLQIITEWFRWESPWNGTTNMKL